MRHVCAVGAILAIVLLPRLAAPQESTPAAAAPVVEPVTVTATPAPVLAAAPADEMPTAPDATLAVLPTGEKVVAVAIPPQADAEEVKAIADENADTQRDVASGEVPLGQATRSLKDTWDPGAGGLAGNLFWLLSFCFGAYFRPGVVGRIRAAWPAGWPPLTDKRERWLNAVLQLAFFSGAFYALHGLIPSTPQTIGAWLLAAGVGVAGGSTMKRAPDAPTVSA